MAKKEKFSGNLFPMGAIKNTPQSQQGGPAEVKQAIGAKKQPNISPPPKATAKLDGRNYSKKR